MSGAAMNVEQKDTKNAIQAKWNALIWGRAKLQSRTGRERGQGRGLSVRSCENPREREMNALTVALCSASTGREKFDAWPPFTAQEDEELWSGDQAASTATLPPATHRCRLG